MSPNRPRLVALTVASSACAVLASASASAQPYGKLIVKHNVAPAAALETRFSKVPAASSFLLVVTEPSREALSFTWSVRCSGAAHGESGGASGRATIANGHWVKRVAPVWIKHPISCSGSIDGEATRTPVFIRIFAG